MNQKDNIQSENTVISIDDYLDYRKYLKDLFVQKKKDEKLPI